MTRVRPKHSTESPLITAKATLTDNAQHLDTLTVYEMIPREGRSELSRPNQSIIWSSIAAGLAIAFSVITEAALRAYLPDVPHRHLIENLGYTSGFVIVILCRLQLFTAGRRTICRQTVCPIRICLKTVTNAVGCAREML